MKCPVCKDVTLLMSEKKGNRNWLLPRMPRDLAWPWRIRQIASCQRKNRKYGTRKKDQNQTNFSQKRVFPKWNFWNVWWIK